MNFNFLYEVSHGRSIPIISSLIVEINIYSNTWIRTKNICIVQWPAWCHENKYLILNMSGCVSVCSYFLRHGSLRNLDGWSGYCSESEILFSPSLKAHCRQNADSVGKSAQIPHGLLARNRYWIASSSTQRMIFHY